MLTLGLVLLSALLEVQRVSDLEPAAGQELVDVIHAELERVSGCEVEVRDCQITPCGLSTGSESGSSALSLSVIGGVRRISLAIGPSGSERRTEVFWPIDSTEWPPLARRLLAEEALELRCPTEPPAMSAATASSEDSVDGLTLALVAGSGLAAIGASILLLSAHADAGEISDLREFDPSIPGLREDVSLKRGVSLSLIGAAIGALFLAGLNEL